MMQMLGSWGWQSFNYYNDPYYYTANDYRYYRGGSWYGINRYGADILRQAVNYGYQEGFYAGRADMSKASAYSSIAACALYTPAQPQSLSLAPRACGALSVPRKYFELPEVAAATSARRCTSRLSTGRQ